jgi:glycerol kinase
MAVLPSFRRFRALAHRTGGRTARGAITGLSFGVTRAHIARAALEAMAHQSRDLMTAFAADGADWGTLKIDGGMAANDWLAQDLADVLGVSRGAAGFVETTALARRCWRASVPGCSSLEEAASMRGDVQRFEPAMSPETRDIRLDGWRKALDAVLR